MKNLLNYVSYVPKRFITVLATLVLVMSPMLSMAAEQVLIEGALGVANQTAGEEEYSGSTDASYNDFVVFQVYYHNRELPDSGLNADNLRVNIDFPDQQPGETQTVKATISADNSNTVTDEVTVNLDREDAMLDYVEGSVKWRYNQGAIDENKDECKTGMEVAPVDCYATVGLNDDIVTNPNGAVIEEGLRPCFAYGATLTFVARVKVPSINVNKTVRVKGETEWKTENTAKPGDTLQYQMKVSNIGNQTLHNVLLGDNLPASVEYVPGSTMLMNSNHPNGTKVDSDNITTGGINIGHIAQNGVTYVMFDAKVKEADEFSECGEWRLKNVAVVGSDETKTYENFAYTVVDVPCDEKPEKPEKPGEDLPEELPNTGIGGAAAGLLGSGALGVGIRSWLSSRRNLLASLLEG